MPGAALAGIVLGLMGCYRNRRPVAWGLAAAGVVVGVEALAFFCPAILIPVIVVIAVSAALWALAHFKPRLGLKPFPELIVIGSALGVGIFFGLRLPAFPKVDPYLEGLRGGYQLLWLSLHQNGKDQLGYAVAAGLVWALIALLRRPHPAAQAFLAATLALMLALAPVPGFCRLLWYNAPQEITDVIGFAYFLRFMPVTAPFALVAIFLALGRNSTGRIERWAVLALIGVFAVHITGGVVVVTFVTAWWLLDALRNPVLGRARDFVTLLSIAVPTLAVLLPQFLGVLQQAEIITGHAFVTHEGKKSALFDAIVQHTRHLNDFPIQNILIALAGAGFVLLLIKRIWWPAAVWFLLIVSIVHSSAPFGGPIGAITGKYSDLFYSDPRRLSGVVTMLLEPMAGIALFSAAALVIAWARRETRRRHAPGPGREFWVAATAGLMALVSVGLAWHYFPRHRYLMGEKYDRVVVNDKDLQAFAYLATLPGARDTLVGDANVDGTAWMYAVADLHPMWTHYDYPVQQGPGYNRFIFWAYADDADHDPRVAEAVRALNIKYVITSSPVVRGFVMPDGLVSLDKSKSWAKIYDNGGARIYEWRGSPPPGLR
jgi:hypothetical protein